MEQQGINQEGRVPEKMKLILSQSDMAKAVEYWLNEKIMKVPVDVISLTETKVGRTATFHIKVEEHLK